jgi:predicted phage terminase large subunit-like protein
MEQERRRCRDFSYFFRRAWFVIEPTTELVWNWHLDYLCEVLQQEAERIAAGQPKTTDIIINVPPRTLKSKTVAVCLLAWVWSRWPGQKFLTASYDLSLALEHAVECRRLIQSVWYQDLFGHLFQMTGDQNVKSFYTNTATGYRIATSVGSAATGKGGDWNIVDDPLSAQQAESEVMRQKAIDWITRTMWTRLNDQSTGVRVIVMQRLHEDDPTGYLLRAQPDKWRHICLPASESDLISPPELRQEYRDRLLFPARLSWPVLLGLKAGLRAYGYAGQYDQNPSPLEGGMFKRHLWSFWKPAGMELPAVSYKVDGRMETCRVVDLPDTFDSMVSSWDAAFKDKKESDYVAGSVWAERGAYLFVLDMVKGQWSFSETIKRIFAFSQAHPRSSAVLIEDKANGPAIVDMMSKVIPGLQEFNPGSNSKTDRAQPLSRRQEAGQVFLPHPAIAAWVNDWIEEYAGFPNMKNDDLVDSGSQAANYLGRKDLVWTFVYKKIVRSFKVDWSKLSAKTALFISQWVSENHQTHILVAIWSPRNGLLYVLGEVMTSSALPDMVVPMVNALIRNVTDGASGVSDLRKWAWYGNAYMFGGRQTIDGDIRALYVSAKVAMRDNPAYNEAGAINLVGGMLGSYQIRIHPDCRELARQMSSWDKSNGQPARGNHMARALCNLCSVLHESGLTSASEPAPKPYSEHKERLRESMENAAMSNELGRFVVNNEPAARTGGWM